MTETASEPQSSAESAAGAVRITSGQLAAMLGATLRGPGDVMLDDIGSLDEAGPSTLSFIRSGKFAAKWADSQAGAALVSQGVEVDDIEGRALLVVPNADQALVGLLDQLTPPEHLPPAGVHPTAIIDESAEIGEGVAIGPHSVVGPNCVLGDGVVLAPRVTLGSGVRLGAGTVLRTNVTIGDRCVLGERCSLMAGVVIGADGFGYVRPSPNHPHLKLPHMGIVQIGDDVEIGANSCVDRAKFGATVIGNGSKIDNLVQIGHGCHIGERVIICGCAGIAGSVTIEDDVMLGGAVSVEDGRRIGRGARLGGSSALLSDIPKGQTWFGYPAGPARKMMLAYAKIRRMSGVGSAERRRDSAE